MAIRDLVQAPACIEAWFDRFYDEGDRRLLLYLNDGPREAEALLAALGMERAELLRAWQRGVLDWDNRNRIGPADFHIRFDYWAMFEGWKDLPDSLRTELKRWELESYYASHIADLEAVRRNRAPFPERIIPRYLLLDESLEVLERVDRIYLWPCNCRSMLGNCNKPVFTCLRFDNARDLGWEISREKAAELIREANAAGLMQSGELGLDAEGRLSGAICNCCADCCFPHRMAEAFQAEKLWPRSRYLAKPDPALCTGCGRCLRRCPFQALTRNTADKEASPEILVAEALCRGCGLCATGCPEQAIAMRRLEIGPGWELRDLLPHTGPGPDRGQKIVESAAVYESKT